MGLELLAIARLITLDNDQHDTSQPDPTSIAAEYQPGSCDGRATTTKPPEPRLAA
jgi:hypothetical protein